MHQLTSLDAQFLAVESSKTFGHVGGLLVFDPTTAPSGRLGVDEVKALIAERLHLVPPFRWRLLQVPLGLDHPYWVDDPDFDLDFHIRESAVPPPGDPRQIAETISRIWARPLDRSRPLWEVYVIHGLENGRVGLLTKVHHAAVDGMAYDQILNALLDETPTGREIPLALEQPAAAPLPRDLTMLGRGVLGLPRQLVRAVRLAPSTLPNATGFPGANALPGIPTFGRSMARVRGLVGRPSDPTLLEVSTARPPRTSFNGRVSGHRRYAYGTLSFSRVKALKNALGYTVNDVVVALAATAVRNWLLARDDLPEDPLVAMVPVAVRSEADKDAFGNRIGMMIVPIPTDVADAGERLTRAHEHMRSAKERHQALPADILTQVTTFIPPAAAARAARTVVGVLGRTRPPLNLVLSNVPFARAARYCAGARLEANYPVSIVFDSVGLNITVLSYQDQLDFGIVADRDQVDDVWSIIDGLGDALAELETAVLGAPTAKAPAPTSRAVPST
jgi:diacylglycerol O-acyltransferase